MIKKKGTTTNTITRAAPDRAMVTPVKYRSGGGLGDYYERPTNRWDLGTTIAPTGEKVRAGAVQEQIKLNIIYTLS